MLSCLAFWVYKGSVVVSLSCFLVLGLGHLGFWVLGLGLGLWGFGYFGSMCFRIYKASVVFLLSCFLGLGLRL